MWSVAFTVNRNDYLWMQRFSVVVDILKHKGKYSFSGFIFTFNPVKTTFGYKPGAGGNIFECLSGRLGLWEDIDKDCRKTFHNQHAGKLCRNYALE